MEFLFTISENCERLLFESMTSFIYGNDFILLQNFQQMVVNTNKGFLYTVNDILYYLNTIFETQVWPEMWCILLPATVIPPVVVPTTAEEQLHTFHIPANRD